MLLFSERKKLAEACVLWAEKHNVPASAFNVVSFLCAKGLLDEDRISYYLEGFIYGPRPPVSYPWTPEGGGGSHGAGSRPVYITSLCDGKLILIDHLPPGSYPIVVGPDHEEGSDV